MAIIQQEIYQNLATIAAPLDNGQAMFLGVVMPEAFYIQQLNKRFELPNDLDEYPDDISENALAHCRSELLVCHEAAKQLYDTQVCCTMPL